MVIWLLPSVTSLGGGWLSGLFFLPFLSLSPKTFPEGGWWWLAVRGCAGVEDGSQDLMVPTRFEVIMTGGAIARPVGMW